MTGTARYCADVQLPGTLWGRLLRSPHAHARVLRVDTSAARLLPGVRVVLAGADLPDPEYRIGRSIRDAPLLAVDRVRFIGDPVAAVAAETAEAAEAALLAIDVQYEPLPLVADATRALEPDAPVLHPEMRSYQGYPDSRPDDVPPNVQGEWLVSKGDVAEGLARAEVVHEATYTTLAVHQGYLEPFSVTASAQADGSLDVWLTHKQPFSARATLAGLLGIEEDQVRIQAAPIGGDFGGKGNLMVAPLASLLSRAAGRPVRMVMTYDEELTAGNPRHSLFLRVRMGARRDGTLTAFEADGLLDGGAYAGFKPAPTLVLNGVAHIGGPYRVPHARFRIRSVYTNTVPRGHMRAPGEPQVVFVREMHLSGLARKLGLDPVELRRRNLLEDGDERPLGGAWHHGSMREVLDRTVAAIGWDQPRADGTGRGIAVFERNTGSGKAGVLVTLAPSGDVEVVTGVPDTGTGAHTMVQQVVAEVLGLPAPLVHVRPGGTHDALPDNGAGGSRVTHVVGQAARLAAEDAAGRLGQVAGELYGWPEGSVVLREGRVGPVDGFEREAAPLHDALGRVGEPIVGRGDYQGKRGAGETSVAVQAVEVRVDRESGRVEVQRVVSGHDVGTVINPVTHQGQIEGGLVMGLGFAVMEGTPIGRDDGRVALANLGDYKLPSIADVPALTTLLVPGGKGPAPFDAKAIGEVSTSGIAPALASAIEDAIGVAVRDLPITAEKVRAGMIQRRA